MDDWTIEPIPESEAAVYWKYLFCQFESELATWHESNHSTDIPNDWRSVTKDDALRNLEDIYK